MKTLSLKLDNSVFEETEEILKEKGIARNRYNNEALDFYNRYYHRKKLQSKHEKCFRDSGGSIERLLGYFCHPSPVFQSIKQRELGL